MTLPHDHRQQSGHCPGAVTDSFLLTEEMVSTVGSGSPIHDVAAFPSLFLHVLPFIHVRHIRQNLRVCCVLSMCFLSAMFGCIFVLWPLVKYIFFSPFIFLLELKGSCDPCMSGTLAGKCEKLL